MSRRRTSAAVIIKVTALTLILASCASEAPRQAAPPLKDLVDTARDAGSFTTLLAAIETADLTVTLRSGSYTLFAPTDEAFAKLPPGTVEALLRPENRERLRSVLLYHVVGRRVSAKELPGVMALKTLQGGNLTLGYRKSPLVIDGVPVIRPDVEALNGVIHVIGGVLNPKPGQ